MPTDPRFLLLGFTLLAPAMAIAGVVAILIPIIIHLLSRRRRRPVEWGAMRFLLEAWASRRRRVRLEQLLLLLVRSLIPVTLGFALAQPMLDGSSLFGSTRKSLHLVIDDGLISSTQVAAGGEEFDGLKQQAVSLIEQLEPGDQVEIIRSSNPHLPQGMTSDLVGATALVSQLEPGWGASDMQAAIRKAEEHTRSEGGGGSTHHVVVLSSFRDGAIDGDNIVDTQFGEEIHLSHLDPTKDEVMNTRIESVDPFRQFILKDTGNPGDHFQHTAIVTLARDGDLLPPGTQQLEVTGPGGTLTRATQWEQGQKTSVFDVELPLQVDPPGPNQVTIQLLGEDAIKADDAYHLVVDVQEQARVLLVDRPGSTSVAGVADFQGMDAGRWIEFAISPGEDGSININRIDPAALEAMDLLQVDVLVLTRPDLVATEAMGWIRDHVDRGGLLVLFPPGNSDVHRWTGGFQELLDLPWSWEQETRTLAAPTPLRADPTDPGVLRAIASEVPSLISSVRVTKLLPVTEEPGTPAILRLEDGTPLMLRRGATGESRGSVIHLAVSPEPGWTDLPTKPLMVPLFQEIVRGGMSDIRKQERVLVGQTLRVDDQSPQLDLVYGGNRRIPIDPRTGESTIPLDHPGTWTLVRRGDEVMDIFGVNTNPRATETGTNDSETVSQWLGSTGAWATFNSPVGILESGTTRTGSLVRLFLFILLALVLLESILAKRFTHGHSSSPRTIQMSLSAQARGR